MPLVLNHMCIRPLEPLITRSQLAKAHILGTTKDDKGEELNPKRLRRLVPYSMEHQSHGYSCRIFCDPYLTDSGTFVALCSVGKGKVCLANKLSTSRVPTGTVKSGLPYADR